MKKCAILSLLIILSANIFAVTWYSPAEKIEAFKPKESSKDTIY